MLFKVLWLAYWCLFRMSRRAENALFCISTLPFSNPSWSTAYPYPQPYPNPTESPNHFPTITPYPTPTLPDPTHPPFPTLPYTTPLVVLFAHEWYYNIWFWYGSADEYACQEVWDHYGDGDPTTTKFLRTVPHLYAGRMTACKLSAHTLQFLCSPVWTSQYPS